ncbi:mitochondrial import tom22-like protein [Nannochloropsis gaditana CCMP526]|uniref:mitochondrial import tom22-like protein n=1 Tax=Nannochloropsis gaditana (strain CCMP526) TaxID=1093141 RepID=UPI00029F7150|nr:mitochondrial import tom22-like protein [Nannochloropsis gaditana CCMP526]EKU21850.1 mitochondrial import tom22-like protein [Nannochloropsis gaditana CCMP526]|eukprot:XP_005854506.1 mitochondrial import tom22-like protein [Nannochloropsis gaditana CCMP526]
MPSSKSVRFEDLDDGVDDGLYGMKGILKNLYTQAGSYRKWVRSHSKKILSWGISLAWYFSMASMLTVIPLSLELQREQSVVEMEKIQVKELLAQGYPPQELQRMGMTLEPAVLNERQR